MIARPAPKLVVVTASDHATPKRKYELKFSFEPFVNTAPEFRSLLRKFDLDVRPDPTDGKPNRRELCPLELNWQAMVLGAAAGRYQILHARLKSSKKLVGFIFNLVGFPEKYATTLHAQIDMVWLHPQVRRGWAALEMFKENEARLATIGVQRILLAAPEGFANESGIGLEKLIKFMGFQPVEAVYDKFL